MWSLVTPMKSAVSCLKMTLKGVLKYRYLIFTLRVMSFRPKVEIYRANAAKTPLLFARAKVLWNIITNGMI